MHDADEIKSVVVTLNPNSVAAPAQHIATIASHVVGTCLRAIAHDDLSVPDLHSSSLGYQFRGPDMSMEERRETYTNWILSQGFQELARGVRETLEEALVYMTVLSWSPRRTTWEEFNEDMAAVRTTSAKWQFPKLLNEVNAGLTEPMAFEADFLSLQQVRNCLEHRGGRVGKKDLDSMGTLTLAFPRIRFFYRREEAEVELAPGEILDTHSVDDPSREGNEIPFYMQRVTRSRTYASGETVVITASDFIRNRNGVSSFCERHRKKATEAASIMIASSRPSLDCDEPAENLPGRCRVLRF